MIIRNTNDVSRLVRDLREKRGLTQAQLAISVGVSRKWIIDLESGKRAVDVSRVLQTLNLLGIELDARERRTPKRQAARIDINQIVTDASRGRR